MDTVRSEIGDRRAEGGDRRGARQGFTLIEMLTVLAIMMLMMSLAVGAFTTYNREAGIRGSVLRMKSSLSMARQNAITKRVYTTFSYGNTPDERGYFYLTTNALPSGLIGETNYLTEGIAFHFQQPVPKTNGVTFKLDGTCNFGTVPKSIWVVERGRGTNGLTAHMQVYPLTGRVKVRSQ